ncbi:MAG: VWA domain-containing protein [Gammaproteobacteria bacterium]|nr:VWA domain-containing protein [Gammaproteobacteria bacterium]
MDFQLFHFLRPLWLLLLPVLLILLWLMIKRRLGSRSWEAICDENLLPYMLIDGREGSRRWPVFLLGVAGFLTIIALAGPVWEKLPQPVFNNETALVIALDLSRSMDANDISPSRLGRARFKVADILNQHDEGQAALLVYAGDAFTVTPLTDDMATIASQLSALTSDIMPGQGNRTDRALEKAEELLKGAGHSQGNILLICDDIDLEESENSIRDLASQGYRVSILGIGTVQGAPVVMPDGSFLKDKKGEIVIPTLNEVALRQAAQFGNGFYKRMSQDDGDIEYLLSRVAGDQSGIEQAASEFETDTWKEQGPWLLLLIIPIAALSFRKGYLLALTILVLPFPEQANAFEWDDLWLRSDQKALRALQNGDAGAAAKLFKNPAWKGAAQYEAGDFQSSLESLQDVDDIEAIYNRGNAEARLGQYQQAISSYDEVLERNPEHEDAKFNKELIEKELENQQQQGQQGDNEQQEKEQQQQDQQQQDQQQDGEQGEEQKQEQSEESDSESDQQKDARNQNSQQDSDEKKEFDNAPQNDTDKEVEEEKNQNKPEKEREGEESEQEQAKLAQTSDQEANEEQQATEQWLRRIPDDPAGLLRRKFLYQYQKSQNRNNEEEKAW